MVFLDFGFWILDHSSSLLTLGGWLYQCIDRLITHFPDQIKILYHIPVYGKEGLAQVGFVKYTLNGRIDHAEIQGP